jgi:hypothetical protein
MIVFVVVEVVVGVGVCQTSDGDEVGWKNEACKVPDEAATPAKPSLRDFDVLSVSVPRRSM